MSAFACSCPDFTSRNLVSPAFAYFSSPLEIVIIHQPQMRIQSQPNPNLHLHPHPRLRRSRHRRHLRLPNHLLHALTLRQRAPVRRHVLYHRELTAAQPQTVTRPHAQSPTHPAALQPQPQPRSYRRQASYNVLYFTAVMKILAPLTTLIVRMKPWRRRPFQPR